MVALRHMKIAAKIGTGYGIVCVLMTIITIGIFLAGVSTSKAVDDVDAMVMFDMAVNDTKSTFYEARVYANVLLYNNSESAYSNYSARATEANKAINDLASLASSNSFLSGSSSVINSFRTSYQSWQSNMEDVHNDYMSMEAINQAVDETNERVVELLNDLVSDQAASAYDFGRTAQTAVAIQGVFIEAEHMLSGGRVEYYDAVIGDLDKILLTMFDSKNGDLKKELDSYKTLLKQYADLLYANADKTELSYTYAAQALSSLDEILNLSNQHMQNTVASTKKTSNDSTTIVVVLSVVMILFSIYMAGFLAKKISDPLKRVRDRLNKIANTGSIRMSEEQFKKLQFDASFRDEVGQCNKALLALVETLVSMDEKLCQIAEGNLAVDVKILSDEDSMGLAMDTLVNALNRTFNQINGISAEIADNAGDVSNSSMNLAQGATEQTAAVAALGQSIAKVAEKTLESAHMAIDAAKLGDTIKNNAEKGTHQMEQMLDAVNQITDASASIGKVIKVIDDIAFQTNILALNAAVEAARAGQHGKGFAVVAEEVRNLAAKSAEAAKDTSSLIENSIQKADLGAEIATATSASLAEIVAGINESSKIVNIIAESSENQTNAINDINQGISQVGEVVHLISKGAELSSSASNSMREESDALHSFVSSYTLKEAARHRDTHSSPSGISLSN